MSQEMWTAVDRYITDQLIQPDNALTSALEDSEAAGLPAINVSAAQGKLLHILARGLGAKKILEIGTLGGYSTIWLARALAPEGQLITLEVDSKHAKVALANIARAGLTHQVELRIGKALDTLPQLEAERKGPFDFIFIDADKQNIPEYFTWSIKLARPGSVIIVDNVIRKGGVADSKSEDENVIGVRRFMDLLAHQPQLTATAIQTVGSKGYDGFAIVVV